MDPCKIFEDLFHHLVEVFWVDSKWQSVKALPAKASRGSYEGDISCDDGTRETFRGGGDLAKP